MKVNIIIVSLFYASYGYRRIDEEVAFADADAKCQEVFGTNIASIHSEEDYSDIVDVCGKRSCYIGGEMTNIVNITWSWTDGSLWDYENWGIYNGNPQGQGLKAGDYYTCIVSSRDAQNGPRIHDCDGLQQFYPICNEPETTENFTSLSPSSEMTYFTSTIYYSIAPTLHPSTLQPLQIHATSMKVQMSHEPLFWIFLVLFLIMTFVAILLSFMYYRATRQKMNQSQQDDEVENNNANIPSQQFSKDEIVITLTPNNSGLPMVIIPAEMQYTHSGNDTSALLEDMYGDQARSQAPSPKITQTADLDVDGEDDDDVKEDDDDDEEEDLKVAELKMNMYSCTPTFDYHLEGQQLTDRGSNNVNGKNVVSTKDAFKLKLN